MKYIKILLILSGVFYFSFAVADEKGEWTLSGFACSSDQQTFKVVHFPKRNPVIDSKWIFNSDGTMSFSIMKKKCTNSGSGVYSVNGSKINYTIRSETSEGTDCPGDDKVGESHSFDFVAAGGFLYLKVEPSESGRDEACGNNSDSMYQAFTKQ